MGYDTTDGDGEEKGRFRNDLDRALDRVANGCRFCLLRYLNGWARVRVRVSLTGAFGVPGENDYRKVVEFYAEYQSTSSVIDLLNAYRHTLPHIAF